MYEIEWLAEGESKTLGGWLKMLSEEDMKFFIVETLKAGGSILSVKLVK